MIWLSIAIIITNISILLLNLSIRRINKRTDMNYTLMNMLRIRYDNKFEKLEKEGMKNDINNN